MAHTHIFRKGYRSGFEYKHYLQTIALGTSKLNYLDPRISVQWCKTHEVPIEKVRFFKVQLQPVRTQFFPGVHKDASREVPLGDRHDHERRRSFSLLDLQICTITIFWTSPSFELWKCTPAPTLLWSLSGFWVGLDLGLLLLAVKWIAKASRGIIYRQWNVIKCPWATFVVS